MKRRIARASGRIVAPYVLFGSVWILLSDRALEALTETPAAYAQLSTYKGVAFIAVTALLLFFLLRRELLRRELDRSALSDSEARYRRLFEANPQPMWAYDVQTLRFLAVNNAAVARYGWSRSEFLAMTIADIRPAADVPRLREHMLRELEKNLQWSGPWRHRKRDGSLIEVEITSHAIEFAGRPARLVSVVDVTGRRLAEAATQALSDRLRHYLSLSPGISYALTVKGGRFSPEWVSENVERVLGYKVEQAMQPDWWWAHLHPLDRDAAARSNRALLREGAAVHEYRFQRADGRWMWVSDQMSVEYAADGAPLRIVGAWTDVTERHAAQQALAATEQRFRATFEQAAVGIAHVDRDGRWLMVNQRLCDIVGYSREELLARRFQDITHADDVARDEAQMCRVLSGEISTYKLEKRYLHKGGDIVWINLTVALVRPPDGGPDYFVTVVEDITDARRTADELRKLSLAVEQSSESIVITDLQPRIEYVNEAFSRVSGYSREEVIGRNPGLLKSGDIPRDQYDLMWSALRGGQPWRGEFCNQRKDGSRYFEAAVITPIRQPDGQITHYLAVKEDITDKRRIADELDRYRHHLEEEVHERTVQLTEARGRAEAASQAKSSFLANMSHEIRTPMNGVIGTLEVLERSRLDEQQLDLVRTARDSGRMLLGIIDDILDFSKIEAGRLQIEQVSMSVAEVVEGLCESLVPLAMRQAVDLSVFVDPRVPERVLSDPLRLRQVLFNLLGNAIKFCGGRSEKRGRVSLRVTVATSAPWRLAFAVVDNGIGMEAEAVGRLFAPFSQAEVSTTRRFGGTGLGLTICKRLADLLGGSIGVVSTPSRGSTFTLSLPVAVPDEQPPRVQADLTGVHCLMTESCDLDVDDLCVYLQDAGATVARVTDDAHGEALAGTLRAPVVAIQSADLARPAPMVTMNPGTNVRHLLITRGRRRRPQMEAQNIVSLEGAALRRLSFLRAVAVAAGRASPDAAGAGAGAELAPGSAPPTVEQARARGELILVAEDDEINRKVILRQLELLGRTAEMAANGAEALRLWRAGVYALLLTDLHMPEMDGYELAKTIRKEEVGRLSGDAAGRRQPIVALTANALRGEAERAKAAGIDDYLTKPLRLDLLRQALAHWAPVGQRPQPVEASAGGETPAVIGKAVDIEVLRRLVGDEDAKLREILSLFVRTARGMGDDFQDAVKVGDVRKAGAIAHKLKSSARSVGALALGDRCAELERAGKAVDLAKLMELLEPFATELLKVEREVDASLAAARL